VLLAHKLQLDVLKMSNRFEGLGLKQGPACHPTNLCKFSFSPDGGDPLGQLDIECVSFSLFGVGSGFTADVVL